MIDTCSAERIQVPTVDRISGFQLYGAGVNTKKEVVLTFAHFLPADHVSALALHGSDVITEIVVLPLSSALVGQLGIVARQGRIEVFDDQGRARRLFVARQGKEQLEQLVADHNRRVTEARATEAAKLTPSDVRIWGAGASVLPNRRRVTALSGGPVGIRLHYETTIKLISTVWGDKRLNLVLEFEGKRLTGSWDSPAPEQVLRVSEAANENNLFWSGIVGDDNGRPQLVKIDVGDPEQFQTVLEVARGGLERQERRGVLVS